MTRREARPPAQREVRLTPLREQCVSCGERLWVAYHAQRTLMTFRGLVQLRLVVRRCRNAECVLYHVPYRAEEEGAWALPHGEFGLDIITVIGETALRGASQYPRDPSTPGPTRGEHRWAHRDGSVGTLRRVGGVAPGG
jgi:hypothetical protein